MELSGRYGRVAERAGRKARQLGPQWFPELIRQEFLAIEGGPYQMDSLLNVSVRHDVGPLGLLSVGAVSGAHAPPSRPRGRTGPRYFWRNNQEIPKTPHPKTATIIPRLRDTKCC